VWFKNIDVLKIWYVCSLYLEIVITIIICKGCDKCKEKTIRCMGREEMFVQQQQQQQSL
jgi:hypothetical protein